MTLPEQKELVHNLMDKDEFTMIVCDAMRYDYFKKHNQINGELKKVHSVKGQTYVWLGKTFTEHYPDIKIFTCHPLLNSYGVTPEDLGPKFKREKHEELLKNKWRAIDHFDPDNIYDIWEEENRECVDEWVKSHGNPSHLWHNDYRYTPKKVVEEIKNKIEGDKNIVWLMWPHAPYVFGEGSEEERYEAAVRRICEHLPKLISETNNPTIITSDHGEVFEPPEKFGLSVDRKHLRHEAEVETPKLRHVPWLEVVQ